MKGLHYVFLIAFTAAIVVEVESWFSCELKCEGKPPSHVSGEAKIRTGERQSSDIIRP